MNYILFLNKCWGVDFWLTKELERAKVKDYEYVSLFEEEHKDPKLYKKYNVRSTPVLVLLDKHGECDRLSSIEEIVEWFKKNVQDSKIQVGGPPQT